MLRKILPHVSILMCNMYLVFYFIDRVNSAMSFINNGITKAILAIMCIISIINSVFLIIDQRRKIAAREAARRRAVRSAPAPRSIPMQRSAPAPRTAPVRRSEPPRSYESMRRSRYN